MSDCKLCGGRAGFSLCLLISTKGQRPRLQKCSRALLLCGACMRDCAARLGSEGLAGLGERLSEAHTAIASHSTAIEPPDSLSQSSEVSR